MNSVSAVEIPTQSKTVSKANATASKKAANPKIRKEEPKMPPLKNLLNNLKL